LRYPPVDKALVDDEMAVPKLMLSDSRTGRRDLQQARAGALFRHKRASPQHEQSRHQLLATFTAATQHIHITPPRLLQLVRTVTDNQLPVTASPYYWLQLSLHRPADAALRVA
jgi:hypothetical protein